MSSAFSKHIIISGFDPFQGRSGNNSTVIAQKLVERFASTQIKVTFCPLNTVYFKGFETLKDCVASTSEKPDFILSLGEAFCKDVKFETSAVNMMSDFGGDNDGVHYTGEEIIPGAPKYVPMSLNLKPYKRMLPRSMKKYIKVSSDAGTFVCNNTAYLMASESEIPYAFIHVPAYKCANGPMLIERSTQILEATIKNLFK
jgi:pyrrolidone-carboxylate peptidase